MNKWSKRFCAEIAAVLAAAVLLAGCGAQTEGTLARPGQMAAQLPEMEGYTAWTDQTTYPTTVESVPIYVKNESDHFTEYSLTNPEILLDGVWYKLEHEPYATTAELYGTDPGQTDLYRKNMTYFGDAFPAGHYRIRVLFWEGSSPTRALPVEFDIA